MTTQEVYDRLVQAAQDGVLPGYDAASESCRYVTEDGHKCAVGCLLSEDTMYRLTVLRLLDRPIDKLSSYFYGEIGMPPYDLMAIQRAHDRLVADDKFTSSRFTEEINQLPCFADVRKEKP